MFRPILALIVLVGCCVLMVALNRAEVQANQEPPAPQEIAPYQFAEIKSNAILVAGSIKIYKVVHQGCEIFIATPASYREGNVAIATGRGCR